MADEVGVTDPPGMRSSGCRAGWEPVSHVGRKRSDGCQSFSSPQWFSYVRCMSPELSYYFLTIHRKSRGPGGHADKMTQQAETRRK